jgi:hypothetical protein
MLEASLAELVAAALVPIFGYLAVLARRWVQNEIIWRALVRAAGAAFIEFRRHHDEARAVERGAEYMASHVPQAIARAGKSMDDVRDMVRGQLGDTLGRVK